MLDWLEEIPAVFAVMMGLGVLVTSITGVWNFTEKVRSKMNHLPYKAIGAVELHKDENGKAHDELIQAIRTNQLAIDKAFQLLSNDKKAIDGYDQNFKILYQCMEALLSHEMDGNSTGKMRDAHAKLLEHIINA